MWFGICLQPRKKDITHGQPQGFRAFSKQFPYHGCTTTSGTPLWSTMLGPNPSPGYTKGLQRRGLRGWPRGDVVRQSIVTRPRSQTRPKRPGRQASKQKSCLQCNILLQTHSLRYTRVSMWQKKLFVFLTRSWKADVAQSFIPRQQHRIMKASSV